MKTKAFLMGICCMTASSVPMHAQEWIGTQFRLDTSVTLHCEDMSDVTGLVGQIADNTLYFTSRRAFQDGSAGHAAIVRTLSLEDCSQRELLFGVPDSCGGNGGGGNALAASFWIYDFDIRPDRAVFSVQDYLLVYRRSGGRYRFEALYFRPDAVAAYFHQERLYYLTEDHDKGYRWYRLSETDGRDVFIRELPYEAPHVVQASPNRYLFRDHRFVYFLSTRSPVLHKYTLSGEWAEDIAFTLPYWHPFSDDYIRKSLSYPYGPERIYGTMGDIFRYSYPKMAFPLHDDCLLYYTQYDTATQKSSLQFAVRSRDGHTVRYSRKDSDTAAYGGGRYPFHLLEPHVGKLYASDGRRLFEVCYESGLDWNGLTPKQYSEMSESFFKHNEPILKARIQSYKNNDPVMAPFFYDTDHNLHSLHDLQGKKAVMMITQQLECSACENMILDRFNRADTGSTRAAIMYPFIPGALQERELRLSAGKTLKLPFDLFFLATDRHQNYPTFITSKVNSFPAVLFLESGRAPVFMQADDIFADGPFGFMLSDAFNRLWDDFQRHDMKPEEK